MHELSIALSLIDVAAEEAGRRGEARVVALHLKLGPLSGVVKEALLSAFELAREHSPLEGAELMIEEVPVVVFCEACQAESPLPTIQQFQCPRCGAPTGNVVRGQELELVALEVES